MNMQIIYWMKQLMADDYGQILVWLIIILLLMGVDVITGLIQAKINRNINSKKIGDGILKKVQILLVLIVIVPLTIVLPNVVSTTVIIGIYLLETYNELVSIHRNHFSSSPFPSNFVMGPNRLVSIPACLRFSLIETNSL